MFLTSGGARIFNFVDLFAPLQGAAVALGHVGMAHAPADPALASVVTSLSHRIAKSEAVGAVLHISAVTSVLCLAYLRLDHDQSADTDAREAREAAVREAAREAFNALEVEPETFAKGATFGNIGMLYPVYVVAVMAGIVLEIRAGWRTWYYIVRQRRIPLLVFYRRRHHLHLVAGSAAVSVTALFLFGVGAISGWHWIENQFLQLATSAALLLSLIVVVLTSVGSTWQQEKRLKKTCGKLTGMGKQRRADWQMRQARERSLFSPQPLDGETPWGLPPQKRAAGPQAKTAQARAAKPKTRQTRAATPKIRQAKTATPKTGGARGGSKGQNPPKARAPAPRNPSNKSVAAPNGRKGAGKPRG